MRETSFIKQNKEKWKDFEQNLEQKSNDPDKLNDQFIQITDDLSYSRTFYPNRSVRVYLNGLAQKVFFSIYKNKKSHRSRLLSFWTHELPELIYEAKNEFRLAFWVFLIAMGIGILSSMNDAEFVRIILGDSYVDMTLENIKSGDPMRVYKEGSEFGGFLGITANNLFVAFRAFVSGVFFAIGTLGIMLYNGIMVGAFQFFFFQQGIYAESLLTIWMHGTFEISAIIISGAAGLTMGRGLVFPGTLSRLNAFQISARRGVKIMIGIVPLFITAGFIEGYITRHTEVPDLIRLFFILICLAYVISYFVILPIIRGRKSKENRHYDTKLIPNNNQSIDFSIIKNRGSLFTDTFVLYRKKIGLIFWLIFGMSTLFCLLVFAFSNAPMNELFRFRWEIFGTFNNLDQFFINSKIPLLPAFNILIFSTITYFIFSLVIKEDQSFFETKTIKPPLQKLLDFLKIFIGSIILISIITTSGAYLPFIILMIFPPIILWMFILQKEGLTIFKGYQRAHYLASGNLFRMMALFLTFAILSLLFLILLDTPFLRSIIQVIAMNFSLSDSGMNSLIAILMTFSTMFLLYLEIVLFVTGMALMYYSLVEMKEAKNLRAQIQFIGSQKRIRGLLRES